jgi:hypothetical protein
MAHKIVYIGNLVGNFRLLSFATGDYNCTCRMCKKQFHGDKRASVCLACTLDLVEEKIVSHNIDCSKLLSLCKRLVAHADAGIALPVGHPIIEEIREQLRESV